MRKANTLGLEKVEPMDVLGALKMRRYFSGLLRFRRER
jgi:hypothetical protein